MYACKCLRVCVCMYACEYIRTYILMYVCTCIRSKHTSRRPNMCQKRPSICQRRPMCQKRPIMCQNRPSMCQKRPIMCSKHTSPQEDQDEVRNPAAAHGQNKSILLHATALRSLLTYTSSLLSTHTRFCSWHASTGVGQPRLGVGSNTWLCFAAGGPS